MTAPDVRLVGPCACRACLARKGWRGGWRSTPKWERRLYLATLIVSALVISFAMSGCTSLAAPYDPADIRDAKGRLPGDYNAHGGYYDSCSELPPLIGDDC